jgi:hypothetical protein
MHTEHFVGIPEDKISLLSPSPSWWDDIKMNTAEIISYKSRFIRQIYDKVQWQTFITLVTNLCIARKPGNLSLSSSKTPPIPFICIKKREEFSDVWKV